MINDTFLIRNFTPEDTTALLSLVKINIPEFFAPSEQEDFEKYLQKEIELYYVILQNEKIIGCGGINFNSEKTIGFISWDIIDPDYQGKSYGSQLLNYRITKLNSIKSVEKIIVRTSQKTYKFYEKHGFQVMYKQTDFWAPGFDLYYMEFGSKS